MPANPKVSLKKKSYNSSTDASSGVVVFDNLTGRIYVGGDCYSSSIKNATLNSSTNILTITKADNTTEDIDLNKEKFINKVTSISSTSTHTQYPSAKCIYELSKDKSVVVWHAQTVNDGILASESDIVQNPNWQITGLDLSPYQKVKLFIKSGGTGDSMTSSAIIKIDLDNFNSSPLYDHFLGSTIVQNPNNRNRLLAVSAAVSSDKTSIFFNRCTSLYSTGATSANNNGRVLYKVVGYFGDAGHTFQIKGPSEFTGKNFNLQSRYDGIPVTSQWSIVTGGEYATINQWGRVDIVSGTVGEYIVVQAVYGMISEQKTIQITYDNQLVIQCPDTITGESGTVVALYNNTGCVPVWSITTGGSNATIDEYGNITILQSGTIVVQATYNGYTTSKTIILDYQAGTTQETVINPDGSVTETTTTETTDPETGATTTETTSTTTNEDGSTSYTNEETTTNQDGSSTTSSTTTNSDGTSSETESSTSAPDPETGSVTTESSTTNYDENGDVSGSSENTTVENTDGSSTSQTTNYNAEGDPTSGTNQETDPAGNESTQDIEYDENGDPTVTGYEIDTSGSSEGEKTFDGDGVNTEFYGFDTTRGFVMHIHFTIDFTNQPPNQNENHHNILTMKRATPEPWYGFQLRQSSTNKYIMIGTQFATGSNTNTNITPPRWITANKVAEYDIEVTYDPLATTNTFVCRELISDSTVFTSNRVFPDLPELRYLTVCIGYALDENSDPYRYSNINVSEFTITKLQAIVADPIISCNGQQISISCATSNAYIYYKLNNTGNYTLYSSPIAIAADTFIEAYAERNGIESNVVSQTCIYIPPHDYSQDYLTFRVLTAGSIVWAAFGTGYTRTIEYSINDGAWTSITSSSTGAAIPVSADDVVRFRGTNNTYAGSKANYSGFEGGTATFDIEGNIMSLINGDNYIGTSTLSGTYNFCSIFKKSKVISAEHLVLPTMTLTNYCYRAMFSLCPSLTTPPAIPATTLAQGCCWYMFEACPIETAPDLLATTLVRECYGYMFTQCTSLSRVKCLATSGFNTSQCLANWLNNVAASGTFTKDANATSWPRNASGIPANWIVQDNS